MSRNPVLYKSLVVGVIVLFIGIGIQPTFAETTDISNSDDDCELCPKASKQHINRLTTLLDRLERCDNQLSVLSKYYPEVDEKYQELSKRITTLKEIKEKYLSNLDWPWPFPFPVIRLTLCVILGIISMTSFIIALNLAYIVGSFYYSGNMLIWNILRILLFPSVVLLLDIWYGADNVLQELGCVPGDH